MEQIEETYRRRFGCYPESVHCHISWGRTVFARRIVG